MLVRLPFLNNSPLRNLAYQSLINMATEDGINASGKEEIYGCLFGRDSFITIIEILDAHKRSSDKKLLDICKRTLLTHVRLQAHDFNLETGAQPGKFIHEFRKKNHEHLTSNRHFTEETPWENPWMLDEKDETLKIYDSIDSTPLALIALFRYWEATKDKKFLVQILPAVELGLNWIISYGDLDKDLLLEYEFSKDRKHGGLLVQSWTDSHESMKQIDGKMPDYPIAPVEVQGYAFLALMLWGNFYKDLSPSFAKKLLSQAKQMKINFNKLFLVKDKKNGLMFAAQALDGTKRQIKTVTGNPLLLLWASFEKGFGVESIIDKKYVDDFIKRAFLEDMFEESAGIRTMSSDSLTFNPNQDSYHNGSFWPVLNGMIYSGLIKWRYYAKAKALKEATLKPIQHFNSPIELYIKDKSGNYLEWKNFSTGQVACREQAWSAAVLLKLSTDPKLKDLALKPFFVMLDFLLLNHFEKYQTKKIVHDFSTIV